MVGEAMTVAEASAKASVGSKAGFGQPRNRLTSSGDSIVYGYLMAVNVGNKVAIVISLWPINDNRA